MSPHCPHPRRDPAPPFQLSSRVTSEFIHQFSHNRPRTCLLWVTLPGGGRGEVREMGPLPSSSVVNRVWASVPTSTLINCHPKGVTSPSSCSCFITGAAASAAVLHSKGGYACGGPGPAPSCSTGRRAALDTASLTCLPSWTRVGRERRGRNCVCLFQEKETETVVPSSPQSQKPQLAVNPGCSDPGSLRASVTPFPQGWTRISGRQYERGCLGVSPVTPVRVTYAESVPIATFPNSNSNCTPNTQGPNS